MSSLSGVNTITVAALAQGLLLAVGICLCLLLFLFVKREIRAATVKSRELEQALEGAVSGLRNELEEARAEFLAARGAMGLPHGRLDLTRRAQALRLYRQGQSIPQIASTLALPRGEVELLIKIHRLRDATDSPETVRPAASN